MLTQIQNKAVLICCHDHSIGYPRDTFWENGDPLIYNSIKFIFQRCGTMSKMIVTEIYKTRRFLPKKTFPLSNAPIMDQ